MLETREPASPQPLEKRDGPDALITPEIADFVTSTIERLGIKGVSIAIVRHTANGTFEVDTRGFGVRNSAGDPMTSKTVIPIASNTKQFTAAAVGLLAHNGVKNFTMHTPWSKVLHGFKLMDPIANAQADAYDILSHRTGLPRHDLLILRDGIDADFSLRIVKGLRPSLPFRQAWQYNNQIYDIAASLVTQVSGTPYQDFIQKNFFDKAGMKSSTFDPAVMSATEHSEGFWRKGENLTSAGQLIANLYPLNSPGLAGTGGIASTAEDMALWLQVILNKGTSPVTGEVVIPPDVFAAMTTGVMVENGAGLVAPEMGPQVYGMGLEHGSYQGRNWIGHDGNYVGYMAQTTTFPDDGLSIAVMVNESPRGYFAHNSITWRIAELLLNMPLRVDWLSRFEASNKASLQGRAAAVAGMLPSPPNAAKPTAPIKYLAGCYEDLAYGNLTFTLDQDGKTLTSTAPQFGEGATMVLAHYDANVFNATLSVFQPSVDGSELTLRSVAPVRAEFGVSISGVRGLAFNGGLWVAQGGIADPVGNTVKERAEVWFDKVKCNEKKHD
ncbi:beta-lactamase/transpeptidase-like protein [Exidia glandulosa HHB12029]|uniref:Beta-lactamase/transpeptidase-like protein n=1 Tax=Exidia glandulosa HHB12029 TaxID=1314781 RepID=A0A165FVW8_EXIGL|nr:beta-lactamase/transpeptidase-like protein [Exidia glandulosa HHB12029]